MTKKSYKTTPEHFILTKGTHKVAIERPLNKRIDSADKKYLDECLQKVLDLRQSEKGHKSNTRG